MKKLLSLILTLSLVISMAACGSGGKDNNGEQNANTDNTANVTDNAASPDDETNDSDSNPDTSGKVLFEYDGLTATLTSFEITEEDGITMTILYENTSENNYDIRGRHVTVNGLDIMESYNYFGMCYGNRTFESEVDLNTYVLNKMHIDVADIESYAAYLYVTDMDDDDEILYLSDRIFLYGDEDPEKKVFEGTELVNEGGVRIVALSAYTNDNDNPAIELYVENATDKRIGIYTSYNPTINGTEIPFARFSAELMPDTAGIKHYSLTSSQADTAGLTTYEDIETLTWEFEFFAEGLDEKLMPNKTVTIGVENDAIVLK